jgi:hypothetical protein
MKIKQLAETLAFGSYKLSKLSIINYLVENERRLVIELRMGRTGKQFKFYIKAAKLALELIK